VVEDSPNGIRAAKNAGAVCVAYRNPTTVGDAFALADYVIEWYADFPMGEVTNL
jgi:beta-phosphoglucomutase-like phosphatase (HAD superfamily)